MHEAPAACFSCQSAFSQDDAFCSNCGEPCSPNRPKATMPLVSSLLHPVPVQLGAVFDSSDASLAAPVLAMQPEVAAVPKPETAAIFSADAPVAAMTLEPEPIAAAAFSPEARAHCGNDSGAQAVTTATTPQPDVLFLDAGCSADPKHTTPQLDVSVLDAGDCSRTLLPTPGGDFYALLRNLADDLHSLLGSMTQQGAQTKKNMDLSVAHSCYEAVEAEEKQKEKVNIETQTESVPVRNDGTGDGISLGNFKQEVQVALQTLLAEHENSLRCLLSSVTSPCECANGNCPLSSQMQSMDDSHVRTRGLRPQPSIAVAALRSSSPCPTSSPPAGGSGDSKDSSTDGDVNAGDREVMNRVQEEGRLLATVLGDAGVALDDKDQQMGMNRPQPGGKHAHHQSDWDRMQHMSAKIEFAVEDYNFLTKEGNVMPLPGLLQRKFPKTMRYLEWLGEEPDEPPQSCVTRFVESVFFKIASVLVIVINFGVMIWQTDWKMFNLNAEDPPAFFLLALCFTAFYVFECGIQFYAHGTRHFFGDDWGWNWFDFLIICSSLVELLIKVLGFKSMNMSFLRVLRFMRISKLLRMFNALRVFKEIKLMVDMLQGCFTFFIWCTMMLALFLSVFAIFFVQGTAVLLEEKGDVLDPDLKEELLTYFGTVAKAMNSLFQSVTGGNDWDQFYQVVVEIGVVYTILWQFFVSFSLLAFFNVIGGVFCEKALSLAVPTMVEQMQNRIDQDVKDAAELSELLKTYVDHGKTFTLTLENFQIFLQNNDVRTYFEVRSLNPSTLERFFHLLLDANDSKTVTFRTFISACVRFDGNSSSIDIHVLHAEVEAMRISNCQFHQAVLKKIHGLPHGK